MTCTRVHLSTYGNIVKFGAHGWWYRLTRINFQAEGMEGLKTDNPLDMLVER
jgi:hypothetical protein